MIQCNMNKKIQSNYIIEVIHCNFSKFQTEMLLNVLQQHWKAQIKDPRVFAHLSQQFENIAVFQSPHDLQLQRLDEAVLYSFAAVASLCTPSTLEKKKFTTRNCNIMTCVSQVHQFWRSRSHRWMRRNTTFSFTAQWASVKTVIQVGYYAMLFQERCVKRNWGGKVNE